MRRYVQSVHFTKQIVKQYLKDNMYNYAGDFIKLSLERQLVTLLNNDYIILCTYCCNLCKRCYKSNKAIS